MTSTDATTKPSAARREGSPWTGIGAVFLKEFADHLGSARMRMLEWLVVLTGLAAIFVAIQDIKSMTAQDPYLFLHILTKPRGDLPSFTALLSFLLPLVAIGLGFDAVNGEFSRRTMSRILAQPIYRDALLLGKFLAALSTIAVSLMALWLLIVGLTLFLLGVPPSGEEILRGVAFLITAIAFAGVWLAAAMLFSTIFRAAATAALSALGLWLLFSILWPILARFISQIIAPSDFFGNPTLEQYLWEQGLQRLSPNTLFGEALSAVLAPETRALGLVFPSQLQGMVGGTALPFGQSLILVWPQLTGLIAGMIVLFAITYVVFQRQEVRA